MKKRITKKAVDHAKEILRLYDEQTGSHPQPISEEPLKEVTLELPESQVNDLLNADVLLIGGIKWYKDKIVTEALAQYAKKKIKEQSHHPQPISEEELKELKLLAHKGLPGECIAGWDEVKFCPFRQGDGNKCQQCSDLKE